MKQSFLLPCLFLMLACGGQQSPVQDNSGEDSLTTQQPEPSAEPWRPDQLIEPSALMSLRSDSVLNAPMIFNLGPSGSIEGAIDIGPAQDPVNLEKFKGHLIALSKDTEIIIYCGCCPFADCPNIRPAFELLNAEGFVNHKLLNLPKNLKTDWIDKGYPMNP